MTRTLGIDLGDRRIGIAITEPDGSAVRPLTTLVRRSSIADDVAALRELIAAHGVEAVVVGLPLEASGRPGPQADRTRAWVEQVEPELGMAGPIVFQDERLTSHVAEQRLGPMKRGRSGGPPSRAQRDAYRARVDREAAAIILQDAVDSRREVAGHAAAVRAREERA